jgi:hypothetical protein
MAAAGERFLRGAAESAEDIALGAAQFGLEGVESAVDVLTIGDSESAEQAEQIVSQARQDVRSADLIDTSGLATEDPALRDYFGLKVAEGAGSIVPAVASLAVPGGQARLAANVGMAGAEVAQAQSEDALRRYQPTDPEIRAIRRKMFTGDATEEEIQTYNRARQAAADDAFLQGLGAAPLEAVAVTRILSRINRAAGQPVSQAARQALASPAEEGATEFLSSLYSDAVARYFTGYDPDREVSFERALEQAGIGAGVGALAGGAGAGLSAVPRAKGPRHPSGSGFSGSGRTCRRKRSAPKKAPRIVNAPRSLSAPNPPASRTSRPGAWRSFGRMSKGRRTSASNRR